MRFSSIFRKDGDFKWIFSMVAFGGTTRCYPQVFLPDSRYAVVNNLRSDRLYDLCKFSRFQ